MAAAPLAQLCKAIGNAPLPLPQKRAAIAHILNQPGSAADPPALATLAVEWAQNGNSALAAELFNHISAKASSSLPSVASLLKKKPSLEVSHLLTVLRHLFSAREKANTGSSLEDQCTVSEGLGPILNDPKLTPQAQVALARLLLTHPTCRPPGVDLITRATIWLTLVELGPNFNEQSAVFVGLISSEWGDRMERVMIALNRLFSITASEDATPSPALALLLCAVPTGFIPFASEHVTAAQDVSDPQLLLALQRISSWPLTERVAAWLLALMKGLRAAGRRQVLASFAVHTAPSLCVQLGSRSLVPTALPVVTHVLLGYQESPLPFLNTLPRLLSLLVKTTLDLPADQQAGPANDVSFTMCEELRQLHCNERLPVLLTEREAKQVAELLWAGMYRHPGHPELYVPVVSALERFEHPSDDRLKALLVGADWMLSGSGSSGDLEVRSRGADGVGLVNCGNTCYAAVIMQSLFHTESFRAAVFALQPGRKTIAHELQRLFAFLTLTHRAAVVPQHLLEVLPPQFRAGQQQDASELSKFMLDRLETELKPSPSRTMIADAFGGRIANVVRCLDCKSESVREEDMLDLGLPLPEDGATAKPLETLLDEAWAPEELTGEARYHCDKCSGLRDAERRAVLAKAPLHLIITLNRFAYDPKTGRRTKLLSDVPYPESLLVPVSGNPVGYVLYAVVLHSGLSAEHGHYYAYARHSLSGTAQTWRRFNDSDVAASSFADFSTITRSFRSDVPYLLFYHRLDAPLADAAPAAPVKIEVPAVLQEQVAQDNKKFVEEQQRDQRRQLLQRTAHVAQRYHYDDPGSGGPPAFCKDNFGPGNSGGGGGWNRDVF